MLKFTPFLLALTATSIDSHAADNCEALRAQIEANIASKGLTAFTVTTVDAAATSAGQVVGSCGNGAKKIVYDRGSAAAARPAATAAQAPAQAAPRPRNAKKTTRDEDILTECRNGSVSMGGSCKQ